MDIVVDNEIVETGFMNSSVGQADNFLPSESQSLFLKDVIEDILTTKNAHDIHTIDLHGKSDIADYMIVASGNSTTHVRALSEYVVKLLKENNQTAHIEGKPQNDWVLIDNPHVIVHLFRPEIRDIYQLEKMWEPSF